MKLPVLNAEDFKQRRAKLAKKMGKNSVAIIATRAEMLRNGDADYKYRAESSFYYLTGFAEPEAVAVLSTDNTGKLDYILFCRERNRDMEIWNGYRAGLAGAVEDYHADQAFAITDLDQEILQFIQNKDKLYYRFGKDHAFDHKVTTWCKALYDQHRQGVHAAKSIIPLDSILDEMRVIKSKKELDLMRAAAKISAKAHLYAMQKIRPNMMEYQLEAEINYIFGQYGCVPSYNSIVGGGANGCILHYVENNQALKSGDLVLIDAGCEYQHYAGDITRTFPVNGKFTAEQKAVYEVVLNAELAAIEQVKLGNHYRKPHETTVKILTEGLIDLGLLKGELNELIETEKYRQFFMHGTGHWLGMDVHDVGDYKNDAGEWRAYENNMVVTIEPGLYIAPDDMTVDEKWRGIGIRIEDDIVVRGDNPENMTVDAIKTIADIEYFMAEHTCKS
ncbi:MULTISPECIES: Xaa-Pro aminopeptidase [unclassified Acinetobacter]|uniref:Xaa-Pro aminopeptidase n=1 Tax=unclassified Acinetobacter TaxID=196816 RepID=UPI0035B77572